MGYPRKIFAYYPQSAGIGKKIQYRRNRWNREEEITAQQVPEGTGNGLS